MKQQQKMTAASRYIPAGSTAVPHPAGLGIVYIGTSAAGKPYAMGYSGAQSKAAWHYGFATGAQRDRYITEWFDNLTAHQTMMAERAAARKQAHSVHMGDIIVNSWGWEQTNVDFYQVVRTSALYVWLQPIAGDLSEFQSGGMAGQATPRPGVFLKDGATTQHRVTLLDGKPFVHFEYGSGSVHQPGQKHYCSWYA